MSEIEQVPGCLLGIDVSHYQGQIDWVKVAESGVKFAWIKATEGDSMGDPMFSANWRGAVANDIPFGLYHVWRLNAPRQRANFLSAIHPIPHSFWCALDVEPGTISNEEDEGAALVWLNEIDESGVPTGKPIVYASPSQSQSFVDPAWLQYPLWTAHYTGLPKPNTNKWPTWMFWQRQANGSVPGISTPVDIDWFNGSDFQKLTNSPG